MNYCVFLQASGCAYVSVLIIVIITNRILIQFTYTFLFIRLIQDESLGSTHDLPGYWGSETWPLIDDTGLAENVCNHVREGVFVCMWKDVCVLLRNYCVLF